MVKIELYDETGKILHAKGEVEYDKIADVQLIERNRHVYIYQNTGRVGVGIFHETKVPYLITEF